MEHLDLELAKGFLRGSLPPAAQQHWAEHVLACARCRTLVESERSLRAVLDLGESDLGGTKSSSLRALLEQVDQLSPTPAASGRRRRQWASRLCGCAVLLAALAWQTLSASSTHEHPEFEADRRVRQAANHVVSLQALERDPWILSDYETVLVLERLIGETPR